MEGIKTGDMVSFVDPNTGVVQDGTLLKILANSVKIRLSESGRILYAPKAVVVPQQSHTEPQETAAPTEEQVTAAAAVGQANEHVVTESGQADDLATEHAAQDTDTANMIDLESFKLIVRYDGRLRQLLAIYPSDSTCWLEGVQARIPVSDLSPV